MRPGRQRHSIRRKNRKKGPPIRARVPGLRQLRRGCGRLVRAVAPVAIAAAIVGAVGTAGYAGYRWLTASERFTVAHIELSGNHRVTEGRVRALLGTGGDTNIFGLGLAALEAGLERDPWIAEARVSRRLPNTLIVELREHDPAAMVELGGLYLADADGAVFKRASNLGGEGRGLPIITGVGRDTYLRAPDAARARVREALEALTLYHAVAGRPRVSEVHLDPRRGIVLHTHDAAIAIRIGDGDATTLAGRLRVFDAAWGALTEDERARARVVYLDNETRPDRVTVGFGRSFAGRTDG